jgi:hypothetical protein
MTDGRRTTTGVLSIIDLVPLSLSLQGSPRVAEKQQTMGASLRIALWSTWRECEG